MKVLITGGAGFIGSNVARHHLDNGDSVTVFDNLSRPGTPLNLEWLKACRTGKLNFVRGDIRAYNDILQAVTPDTDRVYHFAGQVAVTTSVTDPRHDFESNALGSFNILEAVRNRAKDTPLIYASTNKVYGGMEEVGIVEAATRHGFADYPYGISESFPLDCHSPYGCSKGTGDIYVRDYARIYGLKTVVFRQSCIYGPRQMGSEDQGWLAHFFIAALRNSPISIYGDGKQVRDILWIDDLIAAYDAAFAAMPDCSGQVFNIGGGPANTISIWEEFKPLMENLTGKSFDAIRHPSRPGDQLCYVSDIRKAARVLRWQPAVSVSDGLTRFFKWIEANQKMLLTKDNKATASL